MIDVAAQEIKGQQAVIEEMQGKIEAMQGDEHVALMKEMNVLLEAKVCSDTVLALVLD